MTPEEHTCETSGLHLLPAGGEEAFRVAKDRYGALSAKENDVIGPWPIGPSGYAEDARGRFDTIGRTIYLAESRKCSYAEVLNPFRARRAAIARVAERIGCNPDEYMERVVAEAEENGRSRPWAIDVDWQMDRSMYSIQMPASGWWVQIDHPDSFSALEHLTEPVTGFTERLRMMTEARVMSEDRALTTLMAQAIRNQTLHDGSEALGISYRSQTSYGRCWAYWDRRSDESLDPSTHDLVQCESNNVGPDPDFNEVADDYKLPILGARS